MNPPSEQARNVLVTEGLGVAAGVAPWGIYVAAEPALAPDQCITIFDLPSGPTEAMDVQDGKVFRDHRLIQVRVRTLAYADGERIHEAVVAAFGKHLNFVAVEGTQLVMYSSFCEAQSSYNYIGRDDRQRFLFTRSFNCNREVVGSTGSGSGSGSGS